MTAKIYDTVDDLVLDVEDGDDRAPFLVVHRNVEYFVLAEDEVEALAEVFREKSKANVGSLPADVLISAAKRAALAAANLKSDLDKAAAAVDDDKPADKPPTGKTTGKPAARKSTSGKGKGKTEKSDDKATSEPTSDATTDEPTDKAGDGKTPF